MKDLRSNLLIRFDTLMPWIRKNKFYFRSSKILACGLSSRNDSTKN